VLGKEVGIKKEVKEKRNEERSKKKLIKRRTG
jgi:hypothetical protein